MKNHSEHTNMEQKSNEIKKFLSEANKNSYADKKAVKADSSRLKSEDYHFEKGKFIYHDTYFGSRDFMGEEIIYEDKNPIWGANYFGFIIDNKINKEEIYDFLRNALMQDYESDIPVRGPKDFTRGDWNYKLFIKGILANFHGEEQILFKGKIVYKCLIQGGFIK